MPKLNLISLLCKETEDSSGADEIFLHVNNVTAFGVVSMNTDASASQDLKGMNDILFTTNVKLDLYDKDSGKWWDTDDHLGQVYVGLDKLNTGENQAYFNQDGANYVLTYEVIA